MGAFKPELISLTRSAFKELYGGVSDMVFIYRQFDCQVIEGNTAFRTALDLPPSTEISLPVSNFLLAAEKKELIAGQTYQEVFHVSGGKALAVKLQLLEVLLEQEPDVVLGIAVQQKGAEILPEALAQAAAEQKMLLKEVYHRVKNNLNIIISLMSLQQSRVQDPGLRRLLLENKSRVYALALLQERLYHSPRFNEVKAGEYLLSLAQTVVNNFKKPGQKLTIIPQMEECWLHVDVLVPLGLIVQELIANAVLHAYPQEPSGDVQLKLACPAAGEYHLLVQDMGKGLPDGQSFTDLKTLGVQLIISLSRQLKGKLQVQTSPGKGIEASLFFSTNKHVQP